MELTYEKAVELLNRAVKEKGHDYLYPKVVEGRYKRRGFRDSESIYGSQVPANDHSEDWVFEFCSYVNEQGEPSCIVGHVFSYLGVPIKQLRVVEGNGPGVAAARLGVTFESLAVRSLLENAQIAQDSGETWGEAVAGASAGFHMETEV